MNPLFALPLAAGPTKVAFATDGSLIPHDATPTGQVTPGADAPATNRLRQECLVTSGVVELARVRGAGDELNSGEFSYRQESSPHPANRIAANRCRAAVPERTERAAARARPSRWWLKSCLFFAVCCLAASWFTPNGRTPLHENAQASVGAGVSHHRPAVTSRVKPIEQIQLGERVAGRNPLREQVDEIEPDPATWKHVRLRMFKENGLSLWIELLRPNEWLEEQQIEVGSSVALEMAEMGAFGDAEVLAIGPCPAIPPGDGTVVTGKFTHETDGKNVVHLRLEGEDEPTGVTTNHPYWSEDLQQFVQAGELRKGEAVNTLAGTRRVASLSPFAYTGLLNNIETSEHVYRVASTGTLVHNSCSDFVVYRLVNKAGDTVYYGKTSIGQLTDTIGRHTRNKPGLWSGLQVLAKGLTNNEALSLEAKLIALGRQSGLPLLNKLSRSIGNKDLIGSAGELLRRLKDPVFSNLPRN